MISDSLFDIILTWLGNFYDWSKTTYAVNAFGFHLTFFQIWIGYVVVNAVLDLFFSVIDHFEITGSIDHSRYDKFIDKFGGD